MKKRKVDFELISELMKNSKISDRDLAKKLGLSQPTVSRRRQKLEEEGYIKEYAIIPDFYKLGFSLMAITFIKFKREMSEKELLEVRRVTREIEQKLPPIAYLMIMNGMGLGFHKVIISFHENYASFVEFTKRTRQLPFLELLELDNFVISLTGEDHYRSLTFSAIAKYLSKM